MSNEKPSDMQLHMTAALTMVRIDIERHLEKYQVDNPNDHSAIEGFRDALRHLVTFQQGVAMGAFRAETILYGYKLLALEAGADPSPPKAASLTIDRLNAFIAEERQKEDSGESRTVAPWSALAVRFLCQQLDELQQLTKPLQPRKELMHMLHFVRPGANACARCHRVIADGDRDGRRGDACRIVWQLKHSSNILDEHATDQEAIWCNPPPRYIRCLVGCTCDEMQLRRLGHATGCPFKKPGSPFEPLP
jgi:hypothetical protein